MTEEIMKRLELKLEALNLQYKELTQRINELIAQLKAEKLN